MWEAFSLFGFCSDSEKHECAKLGIAKMVLEKPKKRVGDCNIFICFKKLLPSLANKFVTMCDSCSTHSEGCAKRGEKFLNSFIGDLSTEGKKTLPSCIKVSRKVVNRNVKNLVEPLCLNVIALCI
ncbi:MAG: hypothetical protein Q8N66_09805 [Bacteroidota bacterium]|nr:hypothetical protein [Bacteroidota bacterium]